MRRAILGGAGATLIASAIVMARAPNRAGVVLCALAAAAAAFVACVGAIGVGARAQRIGRRELAVWLLAGAIARLALIGSPPVLEDDVNRYLWDGAVLASGESPYAYAPQEVYDARLSRPLDRFSAAARADLARLAALSRDPALEAAFLAINYPSVATIYPPAAELAFAGLAIAAPGSLLAMKVLLCAADALTLAALLFILASIGAPPAFALLYWWNPLIVLSFAGSAHMDALPIAALTWAVALALRGHRVIAGIALGVAAATKLFPVLAWFGLRRQLSARGAACAAVVCAAAYAALWHPRMFDGLRTFATDWQINAALFAVFDAAGGATAARVMAAALVAGAIAWSWRRQPLEAVLVAVTALVIASPAVNPWYVAWIVPFAAARRSLPALVLSLSVLLSYWRFYAGELPTCLILIEFGLPLAAFAVPIIVKKLVTNGRWRA